MGPNPEVEQNQIGSLSPMKKIIRGIEAERNARNSERWNPKDIAIGVTGGILWINAVVQLVEVIQSPPK